MQNSKVFWIILMSFALGLNLLGLGLWIFSPMRWMGAGLILGIFFLHICELKTALRIGRKKNLSDTRIWLMDLAFGFTWWLPLKNGVFSS